MIRNSSLYILCLLLAYPVFSAAGGSLYPAVPEAQDRFSEEQGCVEPTAEMRKNHMKYILHQRDETMHRGIRTTQHSLEQCINCHVSDSADAPRVSSEEHFCNSCHTYAAVKIDCFQCHADRPVKSSRLHSLAPASAAHHVSTGGKPAEITRDQLQALVSEENNNE